MDLEFLPAWLTAQDYDNGVPHRHLYIKTSFEARRTGDWRCLAGQRLGATFDEAEHEEAEPIESWKLAGLDTPDEVAKALAAQGGEELSPPEIEIWSHGHEKGDCRTHYNEENLRDRVLTFGNWSETDPYELPFTLEGLMITKRAEEARYALLCARVREVFGIKRPQSIEWLEHEAKQGTPFRYAATIRLDNVFCCVPANSADPIRHAREMVRTQLGLTEFHDVRLNSLIQAGHLVVFVTPQTGQPGLELPGSELRED